MLNGDGLLIIVIKNIEPHSLDIHKLNKLLHFNKIFHIGIAIKQSMVSCYLLA